MVSFNLTEPKITWKESSDDGWPTVSCSVAISEDSTIFWVQVLNSKNEKEKKLQTNKPSGSMHAFLSVLICGCDMPSCLKLLISSPLPSDRVKSEFES